MTVNKISKVETQNGTYTNCIELFFNGLHEIDFEVWYTFVPNAGLIKRISEIGTLELYSYSVH